MSPLMPAILAGSREDCRSGQAASSGLDRQHDDGSENTVRHQRDFGVVNLVTLVHMLSERWRRLTQQQPRRWRTCRRRGDSAVPGSQ